MLLRAACHNTTLYFYFIFTSVIFSLVLSFALFIIRLECFCLLSKKFLVNCPCFIFVPKKWHLFSRSETLCCSRDECTSYWRSCEWGWSLGWGEGRLCCCKLVTKLGFETVIWQFQALLWGPVMWQLWFIELAFEKKAEHYFKENDLAEKSII